MICNAEYSHIVIFVCMFSFRINPDDLDELIEDR